MLDKSISPLIVCRLGELANKEATEVTREVSQSLKSPIVSVFLTILLKTNSERTETATQTAITNKASRPKITTPAIVAGKSEINTSSIILCVEVLLCICGDTEI